MTSFLSIALGGALGALSRYGIALLFQKQSFPWGTLLVNVSGSFLLGLLMVISIRDNFSLPLKLFLGIGFLGAFTTFSTFSFETYSLFLQKTPYLALGNMALNMGLSLLGVFLGVGVGKWVS